ncbi:MAG: primosomal protein N' [Coriobacteriia bacterium]|nr:primosomal protein N' [Coriobacteriia bacterium]
MSIANVVIDVPARALSEPFDYAIPAELRERVSVGIPVAVPFGPRRVVGYVVGVADESSYGGALRPLEGVLGTAIFDEHALALARWIAHEYVAPLSEALRLFLPPGGAPRVIRTPGGEWAYQGRQTAPASLRLVARTEAADTYMPRANAIVQRAVLDALSAGPVTLSELSAELGGAAAAVKALEKAGAVTMTESRRYRMPASGRSAAPRHQHTVQQAAAVEDIARAVEHGGTVLLDGITGSGKTEVYLAAIEAVVASGRGAIVLVPEISLTPQTVGRFRSRLGENVAVIHSRLSVGERFDQWQLALDGRVRVVVGARSALFAPVRDLALIVIDEEHEPSYKQAQTPRYHARDVAERLIAIRGGALVLGSATPSMESQQAVDSGRFKRAVLTERVGGGTPPPVEVVDMGAEFTSGNRSIFSSRLKRELEAVVARGDKAVLFLNRRGFASFLLCRECGFVPECPSCSVSLTYHEEGGRLQCHHCGHGETAPITCPRCDSPYLRRFGAGTQRAESELEAMLPGVPIIRMDADTTSRRGGHESVLTRFDAPGAAVLLGTQMIAKGLDFPDVTLVGVLSADTSMHVPDFRASERTYQLLEQVAGRAGRGPKGGVVIIQTYWPDHPAVEAVKCRDAALLYVNERAERRALGYPPYVRLANIGLSGAEAPDVRDAAERFAAALRQRCESGWTVLGPSPAPIARLKGRWRWHLVLKAPPGADIAAALAEVDGRVMATEGVVRTIDVDPAGML